MSAIDRLLHADAPSTAPIPARLSDFGTSPAATSAPLPSFGAAAASGPLMVALGEDDARLVNGLCALQLRYGQPEEALAMLQLVDRLRPRDAQTLRLMTQAFLALGEVEGAEAAFTAYRATREAARLQGRRDVLQALVLLARGRVAEARSTFQRGLAATNEA